MAVALIFIAPTAQAVASDCGLHPFNVSQPLVERFVMRPGTLLSEHPRGGPIMSYAVSVIAASSRAALKPLIATALAGNHDQKEAIARGMAWAASGCERRARATTARIDSAVREVAEPAFRREFQTRYQSRAQQEFDRADRRRVERVRGAVDAFAHRPELRRGNALGIDPQSIGEIGAVGPVQSLDTIGPLR